MNNLNGLNECDSFPIQRKDSFSVPTYLLFKGDEKLGRNYVIVKIARYAGKDTEKVGSLHEKSSDLDAMRSRQILLRSDWERVCAESVRALSVILTGEYDTMSLYYRFL